MRQQNNHFYILLSDHLSCLNFFPSLSPDVYNFKECKASVVIKEMQIKVALRYHLTLINMAVIKKPE